MGDENSMEEQEIMVMDDFSPVLTSIEWCMRRKYVKISGVMR